MAEWDTQAVCERIANAARLPRGAFYRTVSNLLPLVDQHLRAGVVPKLLAASQGWLTSEASFPVVKGQALYRLPWRCLRALDVSLVNAEGRPVRRFSRATDSQVRHLRQELLLRKEAREPLLWTVEGSSLRLHPMPSESGVLTLVLKYARRPGRLVDSLTAAPRGPAVIVSAALSGSTVTAQISPAGAFGTSGNVSLDVIRGTPGFEAAADDVQGMAVTGGAFVSLPGVALSAISVGDYVTLSGTSPIPQIPVDWFPVLESLVKEQLLRDGGDAAGAAAEAQARVLMEQAAMPVLDPRASEPEVCLQDDWL